MASTKDLESQAEADRSHIAATMEELRSRMSTGQLVDQAVAYARGHGGAEFLRNLGDQVKTNPLPVALVAAGLSWLIAGRRLPATRADAPSIVPNETPYSETPYNERFAKKARETSAEVAGALRDSTQGAADHARDALAAARDGIDQASSTAAGAIASARDSLSSADGAANNAVGHATSAMGDTAAAVGRRAQDIGDRAADVGRSAAERARWAGQNVAAQTSRAQGAIMQLFRDQPLVVGAVGLAIGAVIGAGLPRSRHEDQLMGEASDSFKGAAAGTVREQFEDLQEAGGRIAGKVRGAAEEQGLTADSAEELVRDIGAKISAVAAAAKEGAESELKSAKDQVRTDADTPSDAAGGRSQHEQAKDAHVHEAAGPVRFSEAESNELPSETGPSPDPGLKTAEQVG